MSNIDKIKELSAELRLYYTSGVIRANKIIPILDFIDSLPVESPKDPNGIEILRADGNCDGIGLPESITIKIGDDVGVFVNESDKVLMPVEATEEILYIMGRCLNMTTAYSTHKSMLRKAYTEMIKYQRLK